MLKLTNCKIRVNTDDTNKDLFGWAEVLDSENGVFYNNIKMKIKRQEGSTGVKVTLDFPAKVVKMQDGVEKKIFYVKPINATAYKAFESVIASEIRKELGRKK